MTEEIVKIEERCHWYSKWNMEIYRIPQVSWLSASNWGPFEFVVTYRHKKLPVSASGDHPSPPTAKFVAKQNRSFALKAYKDAVKFGDVGDAFNQAKSPEEVLARTKRFLGQSDD